MAIARIRKTLHPVKLLFWVGILSIAYTAFAAAQSDRSIAARESPGKFVDRTTEMGVHFLHQAPHTSKKYLIETMGSGAALLDCNGDGRLDIFLVNGAPFSDPTPKGTIPKKTGPRYWDRLYLQKKDGTFEDITEKAGVQGDGYGMGVAAGDYDNDGKEDLYVTGYGVNHLYHNEGACRFKDVTAPSGTGGSGWSTSAAWVDLDNDGLLDLVVLRYVNWDWDDIWCGSTDNRSFCHPDHFQPISMLVYHNDGNGHFTEVAKKSGVDKPAKALGIAIGDYDRDGKIDIYIANDSMEEFLFHNKGNGTFEEVGLESGVAVDGDGKTYAGMGVDFADYNNDGYPDLIVTVLANQKYPLYANERDGTFDYASYSSGLAAISLLHSGWGVRFLDYDNDGWKDLLIAQGHDLDTVQKSYPQLRYREPMLLLRNSGKSWSDVSADSGEVFQEAWAARGMAIGDINNDGRMDALVSTNNGPAHVLINETATKDHWLTFHLVGHRSNRDGIGAVVRVTTSQGSQWDTVSTTGSYLSSSDPRPHFGLGADEAASEVEIRWPSGIVQKLENVHGDRIVQVDEPTPSQ